MRWLPASSAPASPRERAGESQAVTRPAGDPGSRPPERLRPGATPAGRCFVGWVRWRWTTRRCGRSSTRWVCSYAASAGSSPSGPGWSTPTSPRWRYSMLMALNDTGPRRASDLVELFSVDKGAVSRQVQALLELGLIERSPDPDDRRAAILAITDEGLASPGHDRRLAEARGRCPAGGVVRGRAGRLRPGPGALQRRSGVMPERRGRGRHTSRSLDRWATMGR